MSSADILTVEKRGGICLGGRKDNSTNRTALAMPAPSAIGRQRRSRHLFSEAAEPLPENGQRDRKARAVGFGLEGAIEHRIVRLDRCERVGQRWVLPAVEGDVDARRDDASGFQLDPLKVAEVGDTRAVQCARLQQDPAHNLTLSAAHLPRCRLWTANPPGGV